MPYAEGASPVACLQRLRTALLDRPFQTSAGPMTVTLSTGVAQHWSGESSSEVINRADEALYQAKSAGRDRVEGAEQDSA